MKNESKKLVYCKLRQMNEKLAISVKVLSFKWGACRIIFKKGKETQRNGCFLSPYGMVIIIDYSQGKHVDKQSLQAYKLDYCLK